jgi:hypothetical protein
MPMKRAPTTRFEASGTLIPQPSPTPSMTRWRRSMTRRPAAVATGESHAGMSRPSRVWLALHITTPVMNPTQSMRAGMAAAAKPLGMRLVGSPVRPQCVGISSGRCGHARTEARTASVSMSGGRSQSRRMRRASVAEQAEPVRSMPMA